MVVTWKNAASVAIQQLLKLRCCSNGKLYVAGVKLGLIDPAAVKKDSFHYHVETKGWRKQVGSHYKRERSSGVALPDLTRCRLESSARVQFSVRLVPVSFYVRDAGIATDGPVPDTEQIRVYGVLGLVQELCSGLLRCELLLGDAPTPNDIYGLTDAVVIDFVARSISLPGLKCAAVHFPQIVFKPPTSPAVGPGLVSAWLGAAQPEGTEAALHDQFKLLVEKIIKKAAWGAAGHKIRPNVSMFRMDFPAQQESVLLDLTRPCGKGWAKHTLTRQLRERLDRFNTVIDPEEGKLSPVLRLWIARLCYHPVDRDHEQEQRAALERMIRAVCYRKRIPNEEIEMLLSAGIDHLSEHTYPTTK